MASSLHSPCHVFKSTSFRGGYATDCIFIRRWLHWISLKVWILHGGGSSISGVFFATQQPGHFIQSTYPMTEKSGIRHGVVTPKRGPKNKLCRYPSDLLRICSDQTSVPVIRTERQHPEVASRNRKSSWFAHLHSDRFGGNFH